VVVVGGGSVGMSVLYHLTVRGLRTVLLERHTLTAGTTWHSAGMLWRLRPSDVDVELHTHTRNMCIALEAETDNTVWTENGGLFLCNNYARMQEYIRLHEMGKYFGIQSRVLAPREVLDVHPLINVSDVYGGLYSPTDGTIDPAGVCETYSKICKRLGAKIFTKTSLASIETEDQVSVSSKPVRVVRAVVTSAGQRIKTKVVVNAAGAWAGSVSAMVGAPLPLFAMKHAYVVTEAIPGMHGKLPNVRDHDLSIYLKAQGNALAIGGYEQNPEFWRTPDPAFSFGLFELDWDTFGQNLAGHLHRCPLIEAAGIKSTVCGPESFTPDHKPLIGPQPGVRGMFNACGFNSMGMMLAGGLAREVASWIVDGSPTLDLFAFDCARFHADTVANQKWVVDRTHESYAKTYSIVFPHDEPLAGRSARVSPIHDELVARGCVHQARHGYERPGWFLRSAHGEQAPKPYDYYGAYSEGGAWRLDSPDPDAPATIPPHESHPYHEYINGELTYGWPASHAAVAEECAAARTGAVIFDQSYFGKFFLTGPDAHAAVQYVCGADMDAQAEGDVTYLPLCNRRGGVEADLTVTHLPGGSGYYFAAGGNTLTKDYEWLCARMEERGFRARLHDASAEYAMISVQGPHSRRLLQPLVTSAHSLDHAVFPFSTCQVLSIAGVEVFCLRLTFVGELGFELHVPAAHAAHVYRAVRAAGDAYEAAHGVPVRDAGYRAIDSLSAEKNYRHWHADLSNRYTPMQAGIGFTVLPKLKRGVEFMGSAALERARVEGMRSRLVCLVLASGDIPLHGQETMWRDGACVGLVRSTAYGHTVGRTIVYGYVENDGDVVTNEWLKAGTWHVGDKGMQHDATLHFGAVYDPKNAKRDC